MADTILGYQVASPEQQRKTALWILISVPLVAIVTIAVLYFVTSWEQHGRGQAIGTLAGLETKCRYVTRNISKHVSYHDHTGYIDCPSAHAVARSNNSIMGSVQSRQVGAVRFTTSDGRVQIADLPLNTDDQYSIGQSIEIMYRLDDPTDVTAFTSSPLGLGKKSLIAKTAKQPRDANTLPNAPRKPRASDNVSKSTKTWIGLIGLVVMMALAYWLLRRLYRLVKWLAFGSNKATPPEPVFAAAPMRSARSSSAQSRLGTARVTPSRSVPSSRLAAATGARVSRSSRAGFGQR